MSFRYWIASLDIFKTLNSFYRSRIENSHKTMGQMQSSNTEHRNELCTL